MESLDPITYPHLGRNGRLGNQLWQIAGTLGIANYVGRDASLCSWGHQRNFQVPERFFSNRVGIAAPLLATELPQRHRIYLQDFHLFEEIEDQIKAYFSPSPEMQSRMQEKFGALLKIPNKTAVHIRRTDFLKYPRSYNILTPEYYEKAMALLRSEFPGTEFFVFSDDIDWCRKNLSESLRFVSEEFEYREKPNGLPEGNASEADDLIFMSLCDHHIGSNSTYAWWAAFLSKDEQPIFPAVWFGPDMADMQMKNYIRPGWRAV